MFFLTLCLLFIMLLFLLQKQEARAVDSLEAICRTVSLANLQNSMPAPSVWKGVGRIPHEPHDYVSHYIGEIFFLRDFIFKKTLFEKLQY